jgi:hypothetical protein
MHSGSNKTIRVDAHVAGFLASVDLGKADSH